ncbi:hypothetical protein, conserved [Eimeria tenella]|uniref:Uncharacterized protein n=1 Tax=Eimeria tenella TaxID=5802 RepID=U6KL32_EIMTE|nr:hypothetical protein, conserved [Eimeria tenella]CDJ38706.1 hypothetical protein, conserved [Eimeria tenella]|eukprot:XP_013229462.1 hypothetical protein, conserved [Eimeria tenella]
MDLLMGADLALYLGAPWAEAGAFEGPPIYELQQHGGPRAAAAERLLPGERPAAAAAEEVLLPFEAAAEDCAAFLGLPGHGPTLSRSCCWFAAAAAAAAQFIYMCIDGSLAFLSMGGLALLCGQRLPAGLLLSGAPLFAATCALSEALLAAAKQLLFSLLLEAERSGALGGPLEAPLS